MRATRTRDDRPRATTVRASTPDRAHARPPAVVVLTVLVIDGHATRLEDVDDVTTVNLIESTDVNRMNDRPTARRTRARCPSTRDRPSSPTPTNGDDDDAGPTARASVRPPRNRAATTRRGGRHRPREKERVDVMRRGC